MGGLLFGYDWVVIGGAKPFYEPFFGITHNPALQGWAMSCALTGCLAGAVLSGTGAKPFDVGPVHHQLERSQLAQQPLTFFQ